MSPLGLGQVLEVFVDILSVDYKYPVQYCQNLRFPSQMQLFEIEKRFLDFLFLFWILHQYLNILKKKDDRHS